MSYVHSDGENHQFRVEAHKRGVFDQTMLLDEPLLDRGEEVPIQPSIHNKNEDL